MRHGKAKLPHVFLYRSSMSCAHRFSFCPAFDADQGLLVVSA
jgi:hypothetical protein